MLCHWYCRQERDYGTQPNIFLLKRFFCKSYVYNNYNVFTILKPVFLMSLCYCVVLTTIPENWYKDFILMLIISFFRMILTVLCSHHFGAHIYTVQSFPAYCLSFIHLFLVFYWQWNCSHLVVTKCSVLCVWRNLDLALGEFQPDIVVYNAGTDILEGDSLGLLSISEQVGYSDVVLFSSIVHS